jgi:hypothetical protein
MAVVINPSTFQIVDPTIATDNVTGFQILFGRVSGGPYTLTAQVPAADMNVSTGTVSGTIASLNETLAPGNWFAVSQAVNLAGDSPNSPEVAFQIVPPLPKPPTSFSVS